MILFSQQRFGGIPPRFVYQAPVYFNAGLEAEGTLATPGDSNNPLPLRVAHVQQYIGTHARKGKSNREKNMRVSRYFVHFQN